MNNKWKTISFLILIIFIIYVGINKSNQKKHQKEDVTETTNKVPVSVIHSQKKDFLDSIKVQGNANAKNFIHVSPKLNGILENIYVDEGDKVIKGETDLFQIEKLKYQKMHEISKQDLELAKCNSTVKEANLEKVKADFKKSEIDFNRFKRLFEKNSITKDQMELQESRFLQTKAALKQSQSLLNLSKEQEKRAKSSFEIITKDLNDTLTKAPIDGIITEKKYEEGEMGDAGKTVLRIDDLSTVELSAFIPSEFYLNVIPGKTIVNISYNKIKIKKGLISYKSPVINKTLRTFEIKIELKNDEKRIVPGMLLDLELIFNKKNNIGVPFSSILEKKNEKIIYVAENGIAKQKKVETGLRTNGWIEITSENINEKELIINEGQFILKDGLPIKVQKGVK